MFINRIGSKKKIPSGLVGWWKFDEASGTSAYDSSGNAITGTLVNTPSWVAGKINSALEFNGSSNRYVTMGDIASLEDLTNLTISAWIRLTAYALDQWIFGKEGIYKVDVNTDGKVRFLTGDNWGGSILESSATLALNTWYHVAAVKSGTTKTIYINGASDATRSTTGGSVGTNTNAVEVGAMNAGTARWFNGIIDEVHIYNRALSASEIVNLYNI